MEEGHAHLFTHSQGCFCPAGAELSSCSKDPMTHKALRIHSLVLYRKSLPTAALELYNTKILNILKRVLPYVS